MTEGLPPLTCWRLGRPSNLHEEASVRSPLACCGRTATVSWKRRSAEKGRSARGGAACGAALPLRRLRALRGRAAARAARAARTDRRNRTDSTNSTDRQGQLQQGQQQRLRALVQAWPERHKVLCVSHRADMGDLPVVRAPAGRCNELSARASKHMQYLKTRSNFGATRVGAASGLCRTEPRAARCCHLSLPPEAEYSQPR